LTAQSDAGAGAGSGGKRGAAETQFSGVMLMGLYLATDSFTSQWQDLLFKEYRLSEYQMMFGINAFSIVVTLSALLQSGELWTSLEFLRENPDCAVHVAGFSLAGAFGQTTIFATIRNFGPVVFTLISTVRQLVAIVLSIAIYGHHVSPLGLSGAFVVFGAIGYRVWRKEQEGREAKERAKRAKSSEHENEGDEELTKLKAPGGASPATVAVGGAPVEAAAAAPAVAGVGGGAA